ncbi:hypothetical protein H5410_064220 [Solanum commersonii]|uniref:Uncharacterized protein n=1 Tax=Solanum commersonii TaxID=4109 RepID=A0A9J5W0S1_SOLCO|nr:hypothetical protein H5410_064220 [Solanum commersonii]
MGQGFPDLNKLYHQEHICYFQQIEQDILFIEFSLDEKDLKQKSIYGQEPLFDLITKTALRIIKQFLIKESPMTDSSENIWLEKFLIMMGEQNEMIMQISRRSQEEDSSKYKSLRKSILQCE